MTQQARVYAAIQDGARTSLEVAAWLDLPVATASGQLRALAKAGRLERGGAVRIGRGRPAITYAVKGAS